jgi:hypothetical protein
MVSNSPCYRKCWKAVISTSSNWRKTKHLVVEKSHFRSNAYRYDETTYEPQLGNRFRSIDWWHQFRSVTSSNAPNHICPITLANKKAFNAKMVEGTIVNWLLIGYCGHWIDWGRYFRSVRWPNASNRKSAIVLAQKKTFNLKRFTIWRKCQLTTHRKAGSLNRLVTHVRATMAPRGRFRKITKK